MARYYLKEDEKRNDPSTDAKNITDEVAQKFIDLKEIKSAIADVAEDIMYEIVERAREGESITISDAANEVEESYYDTDKELHIMVAHKMYQDLDEEEVFDILCEADPEFCRIHEEACKEGGLDDFEDADELDFDE